MNILSLVENEATCGLAARHGLSLYIETDRHRLLFDLGPDDALFENAKKMGVDIAAIDTVVLSHGHNDHGGALRAFLQRNNRATVYVQRAAFAPYYSRYEGQSAFIGLDETLATHPQVVLLTGDHDIDDQLHLFTVSDRHHFPSSANDNLYSENARDDFAHEQNLVIKGTQNVLLMGCGHTGVVNILQKAAAYAPRVCVGGFHLFSPRTGQTVPDNVLMGIAGALAAYPDTAFYTCHCTGREAFSYLAQKMPNIHYLRAGEEIVV